MTGVKKTMAISKSQKVVLGVSISFALLLVLAGIAAAIGGIVYLHRTSLKNRIYILEIPVNTSRSSGILFPVIYDAHKLNGPSLNADFTSVGVSNGVVVWTDSHSHSSRQRFSMYDGRTGEVYHAPNIEELIEIAKSKLDVSITDAFPLRRPEALVRRDGKLHLLMHSHSEYEQRFMEALDLARRVGATSASGRVIDPRNRAILCETLEDGAAIRLWSELPDGSDRISVTAYHNRPEPNLDNREGVADLHK